MLRDTEAEVARLGKVALAQLVLLDLEATLENLNGLLAADGDVDSDLFVTTDTEGSDGVAGLGYIHAAELSAMDVLLCFEAPLRCSFMDKSYSRLGFDQTAARAPLRHGSVCHQTRRRKC